MTLENNKKITLGLIEEYSPTNEYLTDDEDIRNRLNLVYAPNYQYLATIKKILKTKTIIVSETQDFNSEYRLPMDMCQLKSISGLDSKNKEIPANYTKKGNKIYLEQNKGTYIIEYYAYPTDIETSTPGSFELELDQDAQNALPYLVANDILKTDPSADYTAFYKEYQNRTEVLLNSKTTQPSGTVEEGIL